MARSVGGVLGNFKGKLGKVSARIIKGDTILAARPASFKESTSAKHAEVKQQFAVTIAFSSAVSDLPALYEIWKLKKKDDLSVTNTIFRKNYSLSTAQAPTLKNIISPDGFGTPVTAAAVAAGKLTGTLAALSSVVAIPEGSTNLSINGLICISDPKTEGDPFYKIIPVTKEVANFAFTQTYNLEIDLDAQNAADVAAYNQKNIYLAVAIKTADNQIIAYSKSYAVISN